MAIFTFSTKTTRPADAELVKRVKEDCEKANQNFSALVVDLLRQHDKSKAKKEPT